MAHFLAVCSLESYFTFVSQVSYLENEVNVYFLGSYKGLDIYACVNTNSQYFISICHVSVYYTLLLFL